MKIDLTKPEIDIVVQLMDAGVKAVGLPAVKPEVSAVVHKFMQALQSTDKPKKDSADQGS